MPRSNEFKVVVDHKRAKQVFSLLIEARRNNHPVYDGIKVPHQADMLPHNLSSNDGLAFSLYLFVLSFMMAGAVKSLTIASQLAKVHEKHPEFFDPAFMMSFSIEDLEKVLRKADGIRYRPYSFAKYWHENFIKLHYHWSGDPRKLFNEVESYDDMCEVMVNKGGFRLDNPKGFLGFQKKITSMFIFYMVDTGLVKPSWIFPVPIDYHYLRITIGTGVIRIEDSNQQLILDEEIAVSPRITDPARNVAALYCHKYNVRCYLGNGI
jgi:hypothetical protein